MNNPTMDFGAPAEFGLHHFYIEIPPRHAMRYRFLRIMVLTVTNLAVKQPNAVLF